MLNNELRFLQNYISLLGYSKEESTIYSTVLLNPNLTVLELSRKTKIERTKIYRMLENIIDKGLIKIESINGKKVLKVCSLNEIKKQINIISAKYNELIDNYQVFENLYQENFKIKLEPIVIFNKFETVSLIIAEEIASGNNSFFVIDSNNIYQKYIYSKINKIKGIKIEVKKEIKKKANTIIFNKNLIIIIDKTNKSLNYKVVRDKDIAKNFLVK